MIADRFRLEHRLGEGGMAEVFRAEDLVGQRRVAIKILRRDIATNPEAVERTKREGELLSQLDNPAIVNVESWGQLENGAVFLVMELLEGETLGDRMRRGAMDPAELAPIVAGTCAGLHAAHARGIVHRDLKPDNIFLCPTSHGLQVKLLDFGISKVYGGEKLTQTGEVLGTPRYMSPEQLGAEPDVDGRVDVYALGVILYEALAAKPPFSASTPTDLIIAILNGKVVPLRSVRPDMLPGVESVVMRALSRVRAARFDTAMAMAEAYIDAVGGVATVRGAQHRGMATRAMGAMMKGPMAPPSSESMPGTRPPPDTGGDALAGNLRLGTFSGLEASPAPPAPRSAPAPTGGDRRTMAMGASVGAPMVDTPEALAAVDTSWVAHAATQAVPQVSRAQVAQGQVPQAQAPQAQVPQGQVPQGQVSPVSQAAPRAMPRTRETPLGLLDPEAPPLAPAPLASPARSVAATTVMPSHSGMQSASMMSVPATAGGPIPMAPSLPAMVATPTPTRRSGKILLVVGALLAGAASAALMIAVLHLYDRHLGPASAADAPPTEVAPPPVAPTPAAATADDPPLDEQPRDMPRGVEPPGAESAEPPLGAAPPEEAPTVEAPTAPAPRGSRARRGSAPEGARPTLPGFGGPQTPASPGDALAEAQRALRSGDPRRCVEILDEAIRQGATTLALRRRADCLEAAGQHEAAIRDYQRFCRLVPDHPSMAEVRPLLDSWGRSCP